MDQIQGDLTLDANGFHKKNSVLNLKENRRYAKPNTQQYKIPLHQVLQQSSRPELQVMPKLPLKCSQNNQNQIHVPSYISDNKMMGGQHLFNAFKPKEGVTIKSGPMTKVGELPKVKLVKQKFNGSIGQLHQISKAQSAISNSNDVMSKGQESSNYYPISIKNVLSDINSPPLEETQNSPFKTHYNQNNMKNSSLTNILQKPPLQNDGKITVYSNQLIKLLTSANQSINNQRYQKRTLKYASTIPSQRVKQVLSYKASHPKIYPKHESVTPRTKSNLEAKIPFAVSSGQEYGAKLPVLRPAISLNRKQDMSTSLRMMKNKRQVDDGVAARFIPLAADLQEDRQRKMVYGNSYSKKMRAGLGYRSNNLH